MLCRRKLRDTELNFTEKLLLFFKTIKRTTIFVLINPVSLTVYSEKSYELQWFNGHTIQSTLHVNYIRARNAWKSKSNGCNAVPKF